MTIVAEKDDVPQKSANTPGFYANAVAVAVSVYDISLILSREVPGEDGPIKIENMLVHMSPILVKRLKEILTDLVDQYEDTFGVIPLAPK